MVRTKFSNSDDIEHTLREARQRLYAAVQKHGDGVFASNHEALGVLTEEYHEVIAAVRSNITADIENEIYDLLVSGLWALASIRARNESLQ